MSYALNGFEIVARIQSCMDVWRGLLLAKFRHIVAATAVIGSRAALAMALAFGAGRLHEVGRLLVRLCKQRRAGDITERTHRIQSERAARACCSSMLPMTVRPEVVEASA